MKNILIAGDSWGCGVFDPWHESGYFYTGKGLHTILTDWGYNVKNISKGGCSNWTIIDRLEGRFNDGYTVHTTDFKDTFDYNSIDHVVFLQTDIFREQYYYGGQYPGDTDFKWKLLEKNFVNSLSEYSTIDDFITEYFKHLYTKLDSIGKLHNQKIICIGGWSQLHPSINNYTNLIPLIPSATKLLLPELIQDGYLSDPEWFVQLDREPQIMNKFGTELKLLAIANADKLKLLYDTWQDVHPAIDGYEKIAKVLTNYFG